MVHPGDNLRVNLWDLFRSGSFVVRYTSLVDGITYYSSVGGFQINGAIQGR